MSKQVVYEPVIGLEVHVQLNTRSKLFATDTNAFGGEPNTRISPVSLAYPGTLPVVNKAAIEKAILMGLACDCKIAEYTFFDRKNYFYPDLPRGYQITQDRAPICMGGSIEFGDPQNPGRVNLTKIHLEEDAGKLIHDPNADLSQVDFNRAGTPLIEIVTEPELTSPSEASGLMIEIRKIVRFLGISDGNMQEGSLRCDANVSLRPRGEVQLGKKVEIKNINSFKFVEKALAYEIRRQTELLQNGDEVAAETRLFNSENGKTYGMREKEELNDYRYFPEPDLTPIVLSKEWLQEIKLSMPRLSRDWFMYFQTELKLPEYDARFLSQDPDLAIYMFEVSRLTTHYKAVSNWIMGPLSSWMKENEVNNAADALAADRLADLVDMLDDHNIPFTMAQNTIFAEVIESENVELSEILNKAGLLDQDDQDTDILVDLVLKKYEAQVVAYRKGKKNLLGMFMGEVMRAANGALNPHTVKEMLERKLNDEK